MNTADIDDSFLDRSSAINSLPSEILCKIFLDYLPEGGSEVSVGSLSGTTITLSHVCSHWREVILGTPRLWSQLSLNLNDEGWQEKHSWDQVVQFVLDWFNKAGECPVKLRFGYDSESLDGREITEEGYLNQFLSPLMARIQDLELDLCRLPRHLSVLPPNKFQQLESIVLHSGYLKTKSIEMMWNLDDEPLTIFENSPQLRRLSMFFPLFGKCLNSVLIPWFQITSLITSIYTHPPVLDELLSQCVNLVCGVFYIIGAADCSLIPSRPKTTLEHLVELTMMCHTSIQSVLTPTVLRNFHLPKLQTLRLGPLNLDATSSEDKVYLFPHLSLIRRLSFQSHSRSWRHVECDHSLAIELLQCAGNVEDFDISSTNDYSTIMKALIISDGIVIILPKLKSNHIHFEDPFNVEHLVKMVDSRWHPQQATHLEKISVFLTRSTVTKSLVRILKNSLEDGLEGYISGGLILHVVVSGAGEVIWQDRLPHDKNYWKEGMDCMRLLEMT